MKAGAVKAALAGPAGWALLGRAALAVTFLGAGLMKVLDPARFAVQVAAYSILPSPLISLAAVSLPWIEILGGGCLLIGLLSESSALLLGSLSLTFAGAISSALLRGLDLECGCFSSQGGSRADALHVLFNLALVACAWAVLRHGAGPWSVDGLLPVSEAVPQAPPPARPDQDSRRPIRRGRRG